MALSNLPSLPELITPIHLDYSKRLSSEIATTQAMSDVASVIKRAVGNEFYETNETIVAYSLIQANVALSALSNRVNNLNHRQTLIWLGVLAEAQPRT